MKFAEAKNIFKLENNLRAGKILKPHANKGQINVNLFFDLEKLQAESLFVEIDGYLVPFFIDYSQSNFKINPSIVKFTYINSIDEAKSYTNHNVYLPLYYLKNIEDFLIDYENFIFGGIISYKALKIRIYLEWNQEQEGHEIKTTAKLIDACSRLKYNPINIIPA